ncbi:WD repeat-containing protein 73 [Osmerus mordax]|uniref:WD repeat-containing protein 73 n=1 Tax=Osmerus mordax TaxID=8014 RepID=UPI00350FED30
MNEIDVAAFDETIDDWFIESLKTYKDLHVYQLEHPTRVIEWTAGKTICVAGYSSTKNEILELLLPLKLFADDNQGLCAERDFKVVHGGFTNGPVNCLKHIQGTRCVVTNDGLSNKLQVWDVGGNDSDVIKSSGCIQPTRVSQSGSKIAPGLTGDLHVLHGSQICDLQLTDLTSGSSLYSVEKDIPDVLSSLQFVTGSVFLACTCGGDLFVGDTRTSTVPTPTPAEGRESELWCMAASSGLSSPEQGRHRVARLSSSGLVVLSDLRDLRSCVGRAQLDIQRNIPSHDFMNVSWAPALDNCLSVSGLNGLVEIYDTSTWRPECREPKPLFVHQGHVMSSVSHPSTSPPLVTSHIWHPSRPQTILSAAADGSMHVWDWVDSTAATRS